MQNRFMGFTILWTLKVKLHSQYVNWRSKVWVPIESFWIFFYTYCAKEEREKSNFKRKAIISFAVTIIMDSLLRFAIGHCVLFFLIPLWHLLDHRRKLCFISYITSHIVYYCIVYYCKRSKSNVWFSDSFWMT